jgi:inositol oxygenase
MLLASIVLAFAALGGVEDVVVPITTTDEVSGKAECSSTGDVCEIKAKTLRDYTKEEEASRVRRHYIDMRTHQTEKFIRRMEEKFGGFNNANMTLREAFKLLETYVDASDPDVTLPNVVHNFMTAESARRAGKPDWMQLTALMHDLGKIMFIFGEEADGMSGKADGRQYSLGGDTWVLGTPIPDTAVYPEYNALNEDHVRLNGTDTNKPGIGIRNLHFPWGHDEYVYRFLSSPKNGCKLPEVALQIVRLHSCYPLHTKRAYDHLLAPGDEEILNQVIEFNKFDLYSKAEATVRDMELLWPYYEGLMDKYFERGSKGVLYF